MTFYADTSALVKLVVREDETHALMEWIARRPTVATSDLTRTELVRAVRRGHPGAVTRARDVLARLLLLHADAPVFDAAARLDPPTLRSLDAIHLTSALLLGDELEGILTYDERMAEAAASLGIPVVAPR